MGLGRGEICMIVCEECFDKYCRGMNWATSWGYVRACPNCGKVTDNGFIVPAFEGIPPEKGAKSPPETTPKPA